MIDVDPILQFWGLDSLCVVLLVRQWWPHQGEEDRQHEQTVEQAEHHNTWEHLKLKLVKFMSYCLRLTRNRFGTKKIWWYYDARLKIFNINVSFDKNLLFTLKKVRNTYELLKATKLKARKVENPPLKTAVPIVLRVSWVLSFLFPFLVMMYVTPIWAE